MNKLTALFISLVLGLNFSVQEMSAQELDQESNKISQGYDAEKVVSIDDFENLEQKNQLGGDSGVWSLEENNEKMNSEMEIASVPGPENSKRSLKLRYNIETSKPGMAGYWAKLKNFNATEFDYLEFDVKGDAKLGFTTEFRVELKKFKDSQKRTHKLTGMKTVSGITDKWQKVRIPLSYFNGLYDKTQKQIWQNPKSALQDLDEFVIVFHNKGVTKKKGALYIDNIRFVKTGEQIPSVFDRPPLNPKDKAYIILEDPSYKSKLLIPSKASKDEYTTQSVTLSNPDEIVTFLKAHPDHILVMNNGKLEFKFQAYDNGKRFGFMGNDEYLKFLISRLRGFPSKTIVKKEFPKNNKAFLMEIAKDTWAFFDNIVDAQHGLPLDTVSMGKDEAAGEGCSIGDYTNVTNIGVYLCCIVSAYDLGFITREDAIERLRHTLTTIKNLEVSKWGFLYNYYDTTWATRTEYFISLVDCGWLAAGMYVAKNAFPKEIGGLCSELINRGNFSFFYDKVEQQMWHGYYENMEDYVNYHYGIFYTEPRLTSFIAIGKGDVEEEHWFRMVRTFSDDFTWTTQAPKGRKEKKYKKIKYFGGWYEYEKNKFVPSWGGSMFEALMPTLLLDEKTFASKGLGLNDSMHVKLTIDYTLNGLKYPVWGMSPSSVPEGGYSEYGVKMLGAMGYHDGVVTPHASFLALEFAPEEAILNIRNLINGWDVYGEYGFYDAVDPLSDKVAYKYLSLDQGMILMALDNYLKDGALRKRFQNDPIFEKAKHLLSAEKFFE